MNYLTPPSRRFVREGRPHDYAYDPVYTTSSRRDFFKDAGRGAQSGAKIVLRPVYPTMFSELIRDRRLEACLSVDRPNILENFMPQHQIRGVPVNPMDTGPHYTREVEVTGADRAKFIIKYAPETYRMARPVVEYDLEDEKRKNRKKKRPKGHFINRGAQTDYRESETQTDPYTPPYVLPYADAYPKVMALMKLTWGKGLPATLEDIVVIERALTRRILEVGSRDIEDDTNFEKRVNLMEELETQQWADREKELSQVMAQKMDIVSKMLIDLRSKIINEHTMKLEKAFERSKKEIQKYVTDLKHRYMREERKLDNNYTAPPKQFKRDIVKEYLEYDSQVYAPLVRNGPNLDMLHRVPAYKFPQLRSFEDLEYVTGNKNFIKNELEFDINAFVKMASKIKLPGADQRMEKKLEDVYNAFRVESVRHTGMDDTSLLKQMMNTVRRVSTPNIEGQSPEDDQRDQAVINLQKIIRGRAVQIMMRNEIRSNMETMLEMKALHKSDPYGLKATFGEVMAMKALQTQREEQQDKQNEVTEIIDQLEGEALGRMLDFLDKEMVRLLDERKIHALMILAERERRMREATEAGNRAREEDSRRTNDEIFREIVGIHQATVDLYLEDIYLETMGRSADDGARRHVQTMARVLNEAAYLQDHSHEDQEELCADLVHSFIVPEMNRLYQNHRLESLQARYTHASRTVVEATCSAQGVVKEILNLLAPTLKEHLARGEAAVDGTQAALEYLIKEAVHTMMVQTGEINEPKETNRAVTTPKSITPPASERKTSPHGDKEDEMEAIPRDFTDSSDSTTIDTSGTSGDDAESVDSKWEPIPVPLDYPIRLGEKALELTYKAEIGPDAYSLFEDMKEVVKDVFDEIRECVLPDDSEEEFTEEELDDDEDTN